jgi:hypothetical protein
MKMIKYNGDTIVSIYMAPLVWVFGTFRLLTHAPLKSICGSLMIMWNLSLKLHREKFIKKVEMAFR